MRSSRRIPPLLLGLALAVGAPLSGQANGSVVGVVVAEDGRAPLAGAKVSLVDAQLTAVTDSAGQFTLQGLPEGEWSVKVEHLSHVSVIESVAIASGEVTFVQFALSPVAFLLEQLEVIANRLPPPPPGTAFSEMEASETDFSGTAMEMLVARFPSLTVTGGGGSGERHTRVQLRGNRSVMVSNEPLLYVDGVAAEMSLLSTIPSAEVKVIRVLRGSSAATLYPNASNGVIIVETRRGAVGGGG